MNGNAKVSYGLLAFLTLVGSGPVAAADPVFRTEPIVWAACPDPAIKGLECASYKVPLDYRRAEGPTITLALRRMPAGGESKGILFFNPGGPGGTGSIQFPEWYDQFPAQVRQSFDIISWDPRGIGASTQGQCFANGNEEASLIGVLGAFPVSFDEQHAWTEAYATFADACARKAGDLLAHISTADTARDLEQLRLASGGAPLNYWGVSYGTFLGATYANLFPDHIRTLVLDGNLSPLAWTAGGNPTPQRTLGDRIGSYEVENVFQHFLQLCAAAGPDRCGFAASSYDLTRQKWDELLNRLSAGPIELGTAAGTREITLATLVGEVSDGMDIVWPLPGASGWAAVGQALQTIYEAGQKAEKTPPAKASAKPAAPAPDSAIAAYDGVEGVTAIMCGDTAPVSLGRFPTLASEVMLRSGYFGLSTSYGEFACASWKIRASDPYLGPWTKPLSAAPLIVNTTHDPSTPMQNARAMANLLPNAVLLRVNGYGHTTLLNRSSCANDVIAAYLRDRTLPRPDSWCAQDRQPFEE